MSIIKVEYLDSIYLKVVLNYTTVALAYKSYV
jgi:hypothetical protein